MVLGRHSLRSSFESPARWNFIFVSFGIAAALLILRLGYLQISQYGMYSLYASDQHELASKLLPVRGQILVRDRGDGQLHPLATNRVSWQVYAVPKDMKDPVNEAHQLAAILSLSDADTVTKITKRADDPYESLAKDVDADTLAKIQELKLPGVGWVKSTARLYPEKMMGGQLVGFVGADPEGMMIGKYGLEKAFETQLAGTVGQLQGEKDAGGRQLTIGQTTLVQAKNGSDVVLTIDRSVQYKACDLVHKAVQKHGADQGSIVVMDPQTGAIIAACSSPDFDPSEYGKVKDLGVLNNPVTLGAYEPGSIFKAFTLGAALDAGKISPNTTYVDKGVEEIDRFKIKNSDGKAHGLTTMTQVLDESLNTGTIFVQRQLGKESFRQYMEAFGFGKKTDIELTPEAKGNISSLTKKGDIFAATGSFGQGITTTPIQLIAAYGALANGGKLMRPYIVDELIHADGTHEQTKPQVVAQPISPRASRLISGMLVSVVENGHGKRAGVPGYWVAGKTGTAQVPGPGGAYLKDVNIGSFAGFAPASDPKFVMLVKLDRPRDVEWAESSAGPLFGEMARFLLSYYQIPPERPIGVIKPAVIAPIISTSTSSTR